MRNHNTTPTAKTDELRTRADSWAIGGRVFVFQRGSQEPRHPPGQL